MSLSIRKRTVLSVSILGSAQFAQARQLYTNADSLIRNTLARGSFCPPAIPASGQARPSKLAFAASARSGGSVPPVRYNQAMSLVVVGSVAYDAIETPHGKRERTLGGACTYIALSASYFTRTNIVAVV